MPRADDTGEGVEYTSAEEAALEAAVEEAWDEYEAGAGGRTPSRMTVRARVEWAGVEQRSNNGVRQVRLDGLELRRVQGAAATARDAVRRAREASPARSYRAKGWHAQLSQLTGKRYGSELADRVALNPARETLRRWLAEEQTPSPANQARIARAYEAMQTRAVDEAAVANRAANYALQQELTDALNDRYGATIRFRDIEEMRFGD